VVAPLLDRVQGCVDAIRAWGRDTIERGRIRFGWLDHLIRTVQRYHVQRGDLLAGAVTYYAFLSFFPVIALAFAVFGYIVVVRPLALKTLVTAINEQLPGLADKLQLNTIADARTGAGIIGLVGLLYAGLGAVDALRGALLDIWMSSEPPLPFFLAKLRDLVALILIGLTLIVSVMVGGLATGASGRVTRWLGLEGSAFEIGLVWIAGFAVGIAADMLVFVVILGWLAKPRQSMRTVLKGALLGAIGFGVLKQLATLLLSRTLGNPVYGTFAVVAGLLVWINISARLTLYVAAWTATAEMGPPPEPTPIPSSDGQAAAST
jgi:membrane protein